MKKDMDNKDTETTRSTTPDVKVVGNPDIWHLVCKASSQKQGWMKSTKVMQIRNGCVIQVSTQQGHHVAEALSFIPNAILEDFGI